MHIQALSLALLVPALTSALVLPRAGNNLQTFTGAISGDLPLPVNDSGDAKRPFATDGSTFVNIGAALQRSCAVQHTKCSQAANANKNQGFSVGDCDTQQQQCNAADQGAAAAGKANKAQGNQNKQNNNQAANNANNANNVNNANNAGTQACTN